MSAVLEREDLLILEEMWSAELTCYGCGSSPIAHLSIRCCGRSKNLCARCVEGWRELIEFDHVWCGGCGTHHHGATKLKDVFKVVDL